METKQFDSLTEALSRRLGRRRFGLLSLAQVGLTEEAEAKTRKKTGKPKRSKTQYVFGAAFGDQGGGPGQFTNPWGVAIDGDGNIYVADAFNNRIQIYDPAGNFQFEWGGTGTDNGQFRSPRAISIDSGFIFVADAGNNRDQKFDLNGDFQLAWGEAGAASGRFNTPTGLAAFGRRVYVADTGNNRIQRFDASGVFQRAWGSSGAGHGKFNAPFGVVATNDFVYVADTDNNRVQRFDPNGVFQRTWGGPGSGHGQFKTPVGIAVGAGGDVFVVDDNDTGRVQKFDPAGHFLALFGGAGSGEGQLAAPLGVALDAAGSVYVADFGTPRIVRFDVACLVSGKKCSRGPQCCSGLCKHGRCKTAPGQGVCTIRQDVCNPRSANASCGVGFHGSCPCYVTTRSASVCGADEFFPQACSTDAFWVMFLNGDPSATCVACGASGNGCVRACPNPTAPAA